MEGKDEPELDIGAHGIVHDELQNEKEQLQQELIQQEPQKGITNADQEEQAEMQQEEIKEGSGEAALETVATEAVQPEQTAADNSEPPPAEPTSAIAEQQGLPEASSAPHTEGTVPPQKPAQASPSATESAAQSASEPANAAQPPKDEESGPAAAASPPQPPVLSALKPSPRKSKVQPPVPSKPAPAPPKPTCAPAPAPAPRPPPASTSLSHQHGLAQSNGSTARSPGGITRKFTFTGPPANHQAKRFDRLDYSHSAFEQLRINAENGKLCKKLLEISTHTAPTTTGNRQPLPPPPLSGAAINRRRREDKIAKDNLTIFKRLQAIKPSPDIQRETLAKEYEHQTAYLRNVRKVRAPMQATKRSPPHQQINLPAVPDAQLPPPSQPTPPPAHEDIHENAAPVESPT